MQKTSKGRKPKSSQPIEHWGHRLDRTLKEQGLSHRAAAKLMGIAPSVVDSWIKGVSPSDLLAIKKLTDEYGISYSWLLTGERESGQAKPTVSELFTEVPYFDGLARIQIHRLVSKKDSGSENT